MKWTTKLPDIDGVLTEELVYWARHLHDGVERKREVVRLLRVEPCPTVIDEAGRYWNLEKYHNVGIPGSHREWSDQPIPEPEEG